MTHEQFLGTIVVLPVGNIEESTAWYREMLAFETVYLHVGEDDGEATNYAILRRESAVVQFILDESPPLEHAWTKAGSGYLYLLVRNVDEVLGEVQSRGVQVARDLQRENWGAMAFNLTDPSGNVIHIEQSR